MLVLDLLVTFDVFYLFTKVSILDADFTDKLLALLWGRHYPQ